MYYLDKKVLVIQYIDKRTGQIYPFTKYTW